MFFGGEDKGDNEETILVIREEETSYTSDDLIELYQ